MKPMLFSTVCLVVVVSVSCRQEGASDLDGASGGEQGSGTNGGRSGSDAIHVGGSRAGGIVGSGGQGGSGGVPLAGTPGTGNGGAAGSTVLGGAGSGGMMTGGIATGGALGTVWPGDPGPVRPLSVTIFVSLTGSDATGDGTTGKPFATLTRAYTAASSGSVIQMAGGTYPMTATVRLGKSASAGSPITIMSAPGEWAILEFAGAVAGSRVWVEGARYNVLRDLEIRNTKGQGVFVTGDATSDNSFVNVVVRNPDGSGFQIYRGSRNRFFECLVVLTRAPTTPGDADGFGSIGRGGPSEANEFHRCIAVNAADDGFDTWEARGTRLVGNISIRSGRFGGNGMGFKCGPGPGAPNSIWTTSPPDNQKNQAAGIIRRNLAIDNEAVGFDSNGGAANVFEHNTAVGNQTQFTMYTNSGIPSRINYLRNNLALGNNAGLSDAEQTRNSWNTPPGISVTATLFGSVAAPPDAAFDGKTGTEAYRMFMEGAYVDLLRPKVGGASVDVGAKLDEPWKGMAPDLGAYER